MTPPCSFIADAVDPRIAELKTPKEAFEFSTDLCRSHINLFNQGLVKLSAETNLNFCNDLKTVQHNRKFFGHHDGPGKGGLQKTMLLPSGILLNYIEWGAEAAPPIVLLHDVCDCSHYFDEVARPLADKYRVLVCPPCPCVCLVALLEKTLLSASTCSTCWTQATTAHGHPLHHRQLTYEVMGRAAAHLGTCTASRRSPRICMS
jgi:hypothetical protein